MYKTLSEALESCYHLARNTEPDGLMFCRTALCIDDVNLDHCKQTSEINSTPLPFTANSLSIVSRFWQQHLVTDTLFSYLCIHWARPLPQQRQQILFSLHFEEELKHIEDNNLSTLTQLAGLGTKSKLLHFCFMTDIYDSQQLSLFLIPWGERICTAREKNER